MSLISISTSIFFSFFNFFNLSFTQYYWVPIYFFAAHFCHNEIKKSDASPSKIRLDKVKNSSPVVHAKDPAISAPKKLKHSAIFNANHHTQSDVIMLDKENYYAPDSISPSPKPGMTRFFSKQVLCFLFYLFFVVSFMPFIFFLYILFFIC